MELVGRLIREGSGLLFEVADTGERLPVRHNEVAQQLSGADMETLVRVRARAVEQEEVAFALELERYQSEKGEKT